MSFCESDLRQTGWHHFVGVASPEGRMEGGLEVFF